MILIWGNIKVQQIPLVHRTQKWCSTQLYSRCHHIYEATAGLWMIGGLNNSWI